MKLLLLKIARVPLLLAAMLVGFTEIARGPAGIGADIYRDGDLVAQHAIESQRVTLSRIERDASPPVAQLSEPQLAEPTDTWSERLRELAAGEERLSALAVRDDDRRRVLASAGSLAGARTSLAP